ncbi:MAG: hypothetical protein WBA53_06910 [Burkholderiaceae bacterium]
MATILEEELKRSIDVNGEAFTVIIDPERLRLVGNGKRKPHVQLAWNDLVSGEGRSRLR